MADGPWNAGPASVPEVLTAVLAALMTTHIALIRGINVGTAKRVAMADLREMSQRLGYADVRTLLNSGNAVFADRGFVERAWPRPSSRGLAEELKVPARGARPQSGSGGQAMAADPFGDIATDGSKHFLGFLRQPPSIGDRTRSTNWPTTPTAAPDIARLVDGHLYLWCPNGISKANFAEVRTGTGHSAPPVTIRNWNTVTKLVALAEG